MSPQIYCLGEPLVEFNQQPGGLFKTGFGGDVSNVAVAAVRQGAQAGMITRLGDDHFGTSLIEMWRREGVGLRGVIHAKGEETGVYFVTHDAGGHHFTYRRKGSAASRLSLGDLPVGLPEAAIFYASGISLAVSDSMRGAVVEAVKQIHAGEGLFAFDPNLRTALWPLETARAVTHEVMRHCDIVLHGLDDARQLTGLQSPEEIARFYHDLGASVVALTLGADGVLISTAEQQVTLQGHQVTAKDATGAGDCFNGAFLAALLAGLEPVAAAERANRAAALSTTGYGAVAPIPTLSEVLAAA